LKKLSPFNSFFKARHNSLFYLLAQQVIRLLSSCNVVFTKPFFNATLPTDLLPKKWTHGEVRVMMKKI
jgi:hypothetical protein